MSKLTLINVIENEFYYSVEISMDDQRGVVQCRLAMSKALRSRHGRCNIEWVNEVGSDIVVTPERARTEGSGRNFD